MTQRHFTDPAAVSLAYHGGCVDVAARWFPDAPAPWLDLSTGINPHGWPTAQLPAPDARALPTRAETIALCRAAAERFGIDATPRIAPSSRDATATGAADRALSIVPLPGSEIGLRALAGLALPRPWRVVAPTYRTHHAALPGAATIAWEMVAMEAGRGGTILLANPNNPDGRVIAGERIAAIARPLAARGGVLVVDEAFAEANPAASVLPHLDPDDRVLVFRSFGKFFGLAGLRLGFACGADALVAAVAVAMGDWPVSAHALAWGRAAYADTAWITATRAHLVAAAGALDRLLAQHGLQAMGECPLFRLVDHVDAGAIFLRLARAGILVRPFDHHPRWLRFGLPGDAEAVARLDAALRHR